MLEWEIQWKFLIFYRLFILYSFKFCELICYKCWLYIVKVVKNMVENNYYYYNFFFGFYFLIIERFIDQ